MLLKCSNKFISKVLRSLPFAITYVDNLLITSNSFEEHLEHLKKHMELSSPMFSSISLEYPILTSLATILMLLESGHLNTKSKLSGNFLSQLPTKSFKQFLGLINIYWWFIPHCAAILQPINELLKDSKELSDVLS